MRGRHVSVFRPRVTQYWDWQTGAIRNEIARMENITPEMFRRMPSAEKGRRTTKLKEMKKELATRQD